MLYICIYIFFKLFKRITLTHILIKESIIEKVIKFHKVKFVNIGFLFQVY